MHGNNPYTQQSYGNHYGGSNPQNTYGMNPYAQQGQVNPYVQQQSSYYGQPQPQQRQGYYNNQVGMPLTNVPNMGHPQRQYVPQAPQDNPYNISRSGSNINMSSLNKKRPRGSSGPREVTAANLPRRFADNPPYIAEYFSKCGRIMQMHVPRFPDTGKPKSLAYLKFSTLEEAQRALNLNGSYIGKKQIRVHISSKQNEFTGSTKTIEVKNYMVGILKEKVQSDFAHYGNISHIDIKENPNSGTADVTVTFLSIDSVETAINSYNPYLFVGEYNFEKRAKHSESHHIGSSEVQRGGTELFVCRIPPAYYLDQDKLRALFEEAGKILSINILKNNESGKPKSMGYIRFSNHQEAQRAIEMFDNKILIQNERSIGVSYSKNQCGVYSGKTKTVRIGNLPSDVTDDEVRKDFSTHGSITTLNVVRKRGQVFAFVTYADVESVKKALAVPHQHINIEEWQDAPPKHVQGSRSHHSHGSHHHSHGSHHGHHGSQMGHNVPPPMMHHQPPPQYPYMGQQPNQYQPPHAPMMGVPNMNAPSNVMGSAPSEKYLDYHEVFVGNIPYEVCNEHFLRNEFGQFGPIIDIRIPTNKQGQPKGFVFIRYQSTESASRACVRNNTMLANRNINVKITEKTVPQNPHHGSHHSQPPPSSYQGSTQRRNTRSNRYREDVPKSTTEIHIENLPFSHCNKDMLRDVFGPFGAIRHIKFPPPSNKGTPRGYAYIDYDRPEDAQRALSLDRTILNGRNLAITFADVRQYHSPSSQRSPRYESHSPRYSSKSPQRHSPNHRSPPKQLSPRVKEDTASPSKNEPVPSNDESTPSLNTDEQPQSEQVEQKVEETKEKEEPIENKNPEDTSNKEENPIKEPEIKGSSKEEEEVNDLN
mmetsp:Transcript_6786/g.9889  ORF Transcript_6786/g.9889 Transcript_6786/m.9889 type:complete len:874 (-) Transcript_6786:48-2669(-)|eukprot:CAMPEP_0117418800 /NCGR_PEP_ID=MMETSP0758-20121206/507_1 /TAXON_ID=63605 /ORGANISM="Percolomonas cosmopolitus, Strain AE-1 (ATCC 50343)" /LENGTH=873 /DNA_ID=CAMNT_0005199517 /DNA_START=9 /DNA_END=2630 /DNA_ORIENTATION=+